MENTSQRSFLRFPPEKATALLKLRESDVRVFNDAVILETERTIETQRRPFFEEGPF
jgi:hypothetical protein